MTEIGNRRSERTDKPGGDIIAAVDPILMRDRIIDIVRDAIISGKLKSGQRVRERIFGGLMKAITA